MIRRDVRRRRALDPAVLAGVFELVPVAILAAAFNTFGLMSGDNSAPEKVLWILACRSARVRLR